MNAHPALTAEHEALRETMRRFVAREITPQAATWDELTRRRNFRASSTGKSQRTACSLVELEVP
jgi:alkylation response protein AidB-like acyl-CoA dehydrogenase